MSSEGILSFSLAGKNECQLCEKSFVYCYDLLRHQHTIHGEKSFECSLCPYRTAKKDKLVSHQKVHTKTSSDQTTNIKPENETETQLSPKKIDLPNQTQQPSNLKRKISHQDPVTFSKYSREENIIDPNDNDQFLNNIQKHENHDQAFLKFSQRYSEPWRDDEQLKQLYKTHMSQIKDQEIRGRRTRAYLCYLNDQQSL